MSESECEWPALPSRGGKLPLLQDLTGEHTPPLCLPESAAIVTYLCERYSQSSLLAASHGGGGAPPRLLPPHGSRERALPCSVRFGIATCVSMTGMENSARTSRSTSRDAV